MDGVEAADRALEREALGADQLIEMTGATAAQVYSVLTEFEFGGAVQRREGGIFARSQAS